MHCHSLAFFTIYTTYIHALDKIREKILRFFDFFVVKGFSGMVYY